MADSKKKGTKSDGTTKPRAERRPPVEFTGIKVVEAIPEGGRQSKRLATILGEVAKLPDGTKGEVLDFTSMGEVANRSASSSASSLNKAAEKRLLKAVFTAAAGKVWVQVGISTAAPDEK